jgi:hypothetical protein
MEYQLIRIDQLPNGTINVNSPVMFGNGQFIEKTTLSNLLALVPAPTINTKMSLTDLEITVLEADLSTFLSSVSLTIAAGDVKLIRFAVIKSDGRLSRFTYGVPLIAGTYASLGNEITFDDLILVNEEPIIEGVGANTITYSYPSIAAINALDPSLDLSDENFVYILILGGVPFQFIGTNGFYGANDLQLQTSDLLQLTSELLSDQDNLPTPVTLYLSDLGLTEFGTDAEMQTALQAYFTANPQAVGEKEIFDFIIEPDPEWNFDITANWSLASITDEHSFVSFLENSQGLTNVVVNDFNLNDNRLRCILQADGIILDFLFYEITEFKGIGNINGLTSLVLSNNDLTEFNPSIALPTTLETLELNDNQLTNFNPLISLPVSLQFIELSNNQMTTLGYTESETWATNQPSFTSVCEIKFNDNIDSVSGTNLEAILLTKNATVIP